QLRDPHQVELVVLVRGQLRGRQGGDHVPRRVVDQVVLLGGAHERGQPGGVRERVQVVLMTQERFPLLAVLPPPRCPQGDHVALWQPKLDGNDVLRHLSVPPSPNPTSRKPTGRGNTLRNPVSLTR